MLKEKTPMSLKIPIFLFSYREMFSKAVCDRHTCSKVDLDDDRDRDK